MSRNVAVAWWAAVVVLAPALCAMARASAAQDAARREGPARQAAAPSPGGQAGHVQGAAPNQGARPTAKREPPAAPQGAYDVVEWVVLVCDPNQPGANAERLFQSTMPEFAASRRPAAPADAAGRPSPAGVIRVLRAGGASGDGEKVDVLLQAPGGRFLGTWPKGKGRSDRQLWEGYELTGEPAPLKELPPGHWFGALRDAPSAFLRRGRAAERFLFYDVELNYALPLRAAGGPKGNYQLSNNGRSPLHDVTVFKPERGGWRTGFAPTIPAVKGATPTSAASRATTEGTQSAPGLPPEIAARVVRRPGGVAGQDAGAGLPTTNATAVAPSTGLPPGASIVSVAADSPPADAGGALSAWGEQLKSAGLVAADVPQILRILEAQALDRRRMTVVYRLNPEELDRLLPLEVTPTPRRTVRVGLVVARNIDPAVGGEIDQLVAQLASPNWDQREAASKQLAELGPAARPKLQAALQQKDLEVVWRAERLLQALETPPPPGRQPGR